MSVKLLTEHNLEFLSLKGGCTCSSEFTLVKTPHCWKSHVAVHLLDLLTLFILYLLYQCVWDYDDHNPIHIDTISTELFILYLLFTFFTNQSTIFQLCQDGSSWVEPVPSKDSGVLLIDTTQ